MQKVNGKNAPTSSAEMQISVSGFHATKRANADLSCVAQAKFQRLAGIVIDAGRALFDRPHAGGKGAFHVNGIAALVQGA